MLKPIGLCYITYREDEGKTEEMRTFVEICRAEGTADGRFGKRRKS